MDWILDLYDTLKFLKSRLNINEDDIDKEELIKFQFRKAWKVIKKYTRSNDEELTNYLDEVIDLTIYYYQHQKNVGIKSKTEGIISLNFEMEDIPIAIKSRLPLQSIRMW